MKYLTLTLTLVLLSMTVQAAGQTKVCWDANSESDLAGYRIYIDGQQIGETALTCFPLPEGAGEIYVTAYDASGNESGPSNKVVYSLDLSAPVAPVGVHLE